MFYHLLWFTVISTVVAYVVLVVWGQIVFASASGHNDPVVIRDELGPGSHHLSGMVMVDQTCYQLQEKVNQMSSTLYEIEFKSWEEPSVPCKVERTPRWFHQALFAPAVGVDFIATLDGIALSIAVIPVIEH